MEEAKHMSGSDAGVSTTNRFLQNWRKFVTIALIFTRTLKYMGSAGTPFSKIKLFYKQSVNRHPHLLVSVAAASLLCALNCQPKVHGLCTLVFLVHGVIAFLKLFHIKCYK